MKSIWPVLTLIVAVPLTAFLSQGAEPKPLPKGVKVPPGFRATLFASPPDIGYPTCLAAVPSGEVYVGIDENGSLDAKPKRGRVVRCIDTDGDGQADQFKTFAEMDSPRGLWFENKTLYVMHPPFLSAFHDDDGDGVSDRSEILIRGLGFDLKFRGADHTVNGMRMAIDGWLYIAVGDYGAIKATGTDGAELQLHGGGVVRVRPDGSGLELVSRGQRNIYDVAVSPELDLFTRDNTNDGGGWDVRLSHVVATANYGYPSLFKNFSNEVVAPLADYGGGSPCGSLFMDEPGFPAGTGTALYTCEWGRNGVFRHPLTRRGSSFEAGQESFLELPRPTDMDTDGRSHIFVASWAGGNFTYVGPEVGYVLQLAPEGSAKTSYPEIGKLKDVELIDLLKSPSGVWRLYAQREILRRGARAEILDSLRALASATGSIATRVASLFTWRQLSPKDPGMLISLAADSSLREYVIRALADDKSSIHSRSESIFIQGLADANPRVRLQAAIAVGRLGRVENGKLLLPLTADADPTIAHVAVQNLVSLKAFEPCLAAFDAGESQKYQSGAGLVLQSLHEPAVVSGLTHRLETVSESATRTAILKVLCRLYQREAAWDGKWWGTRPDTSGPYFKPETWEESTRIAEALRRVVPALDAQSMTLISAEILKNRIELPELLSLAFKVAESNASARASLVDLLSGRTGVAGPAAQFLVRVAETDAEPLPIRIKAVRALQRSADAGSLDAVVKVLVEVQRRDDLASVWDEFVREGRNGQNVEFYVQLARDGEPARRVLGYSVLINIASQRGGGVRRGRSTALETIEAAWAKPEATVALLEAIGRSRAQDYADQVRISLRSDKADIRQAALYAAGRLKLSVEPSGPLIETLTYEQVVADATKQTGEAKIGAEVFTRQGCVNCHTVSAEEPVKGPFLGGIATRYSRAELCESILKPGAKIAQGFETQWFATTDGEEVEGFVVKESGDEVEVRNILGVTATISKKNVKQRGKRDTSVMPAGLGDKLTVPELASLLAYLESLKSK